MGSVSGCKNISGKGPSLSADICETIELLLKDRHEETVSLGVIVDHLRERGFGILMLLIVLPNCVPIPVPPGTSTVFSLPLLFLSLQMVLGRPEPWMPKKLAEKQVSVRHLRRVVEVVIPRLRRIQKYVKPRFEFASSKTGERILGVLWVLFSLCIAIPFPMTNFLPGVGILVSAFGLVNRDGYLMLGGIAIGFLGILFTSALFLWGKHFFDVAFF